MAYAGRVISAEFVPVTDFREAKCRKFTEGHCDRGGYCNFLHPKYVSRSQRKALDKWMYEEFPEYKVAKKERDLLIEANGGPEKLRSRSRSRENRERPRRDERSRADDRPRRDDRKDYRREEDERARLKNPESRSHRKEDDYQSSSYKGKDSYREHDKGRSERPIDQY